MGESMRGILAREAREAKAIAEAEDRGERVPAPGQRGRRQTPDPSQVYSVRIPVERLEQLRALAIERGIAPTALLRQFVLGRLDIESAPVRVTSLPARDPKELRIGPSRNAPFANVVSLRDRQAL